MVLSAKKNYQKLSIPPTSFRKITRKQVERTQVAILNEQLIEDNLEVAGPSLE